MYEFTIDFFYVIAGFFRNFIRFSKDFSSFIEKTKGKHLVLPKFILYAHIFGRNMNKGLIF